MPLQDDDAVGVHMAINPRRWPGPLVAIGGAEDKSSDRGALSRVLALAPTDAPEVAVIATASGAPETVLTAYREAFESMGASAVHALDVREREHAGSAENLALVRRSAAVFFTGGDQLRLTSVLGGSDLLTAIRERFQEGAVVAGSSAGAVALSSTMIYNGAAADALRKGAVKMTSGLGFVDDVIIDSHFLERGRFTRLMEAGATNPEYLGIGLGEDAGVVVHGNQVLEAIGAGHVIIVDSSELVGSNVAELSNDEPIAMERVVMHALTGGYGYDLAQRGYLDPDALTANLPSRN